MREIAATMRRTRDNGEKILAVLGPAVVHTGGVEHICKLIRAGYLNVLFAGNALATKFNTIVTNPGHATFHEDAVGNISLSAPVAA